MATDIEKIKKSEKDEQTDAQKKREEFKQLVEQVKASKSVDDTVNFLTGQMLDTKDKAEDKTVAAQNAEEEVQKAISDLEKAAEELNNAVKTEEERRKVLDLATKALVEAERTKEEKAAKLQIDSANAQLKKDLDEVVAKLAEKQAEKDQALSSLQDASNEKNIKENAYKSADLALQQTLKSVKEVREEEERLLALFGKLYKGVGEVRSIGSNCLSRFFDKVTENWVTTLLSAVALFGFYVFYEGITGPFIDLIKEIDVARGLITFMVALITAILAIVLSIYPIAASCDKDGKPDIKERFLMGKEVLTIFVGILGTIVGFYFASDHKEVSGNEQLMSNFFISPSEVQFGGDFTLATLIQGGTSPFSYKISSDPTGIEKSGTINENSFLVPLKAPTCIKKGGLIGGAIESLTPGESSCVQEDTTYQINLIITDSVGKQIFEAKQLLTVKKPSLAASSPASGSGSVSSMDLTLDPATVIKGEEFKLTGKLAPGTKFEITSDKELKTDPTLSEPAQSSSNEQREVSMTFKILKENPPGTYTLTIKLTDKDGNIIDDKITKTLIVTE